MAADALVSIGLDVEGITADAKKAVIAIQNELKNLPTNILSKNFQEVSNEARRMATDIKNSMAMLIVSGKQGSEEYKKLEEELKKVTAESKKFEEALKEVDKSLEDIGENGKKLGETTGKGFIEKFKEQIQSGNFNLGSILSGGGKLGVGIAAATGIIEGIKGIANAFQDLYKTGAKIDELNDSLRRSFMQAGVATEYLDSQVERANKFATELAFQYGFSKQQIKEYTAQIASLGGLVGPENEKLTKLALGVEKVTEGMVRGEEVIRAFTRGMADPEAASAIERLIRRFPALSNVLRDNVSTTDKLNNALQTLSPTFAQLEEDFGGSEGAFERFSMTLNEIKSKIASGFFDLVNEAIKPLNEALKKIDFSAIGEGIKSVMVVIKEYFQILISYFRMIYEPIWNILKNLFKGIKEGWGDALSSSKNSLASFFNTIGSIFNFVKNFINGIIEFLRPLLEGIGKLVGDIISGVVEFISNTVGTIIQSLKSIFDEISKLFSDLFGEQVGKSIKGLDILKSILSEIGNVIKSILQITTQVLIITTKIAVSLVKEVFAAIRQIVSWLKTAYNFLAENIAKAVSYISNLFASVYNWISNSVTSFLKWLGLLETVKSVINAIYEGIKAAVQWIVDLANKVGNLFGSVKEFLGFSPDEAKKEGEKTGTKIAEGIIDSFRQQGRNLQDALGRYLSMSDEDIKRNKAKIQKLISESNQFLESIKGKSQYSDLYQGISASIQQLQTKLGSLKKEKIEKNELSSAFEKLSSALETSNQSLESFKKQYQETIATLTKSIEETQLETQKIISERLYEERIAVLEDQKNKIKESGANEIQMQYQLLEIEKQIILEKQKQKENELQVEFEQKKKSLELAREEAKTKIEYAAKEMKEKIRYALEEARTKKQIEKATTEEDLERVEKELQTRMVKIDEETQKQKAEIDEKYNQYIFAVETQYQEKRKSLQESTNREIERKTKEVTQNVTKAITGEAKDVRKAYEDMTKAILSAFEAIFSQSKKIAEEQRKLEEDKRKGMDELLSDAVRNNISYNEYMKRRLEIEKKYAEQSKELQKKMISGWEAVGMGISGVAEGLKGAITENYNETLANAKGSTEDFAKSAEQAGIILGLSLMEGAAKGQKATKVLAQTLLQMLPKFVATYAAQIWGAFTSLGPWMIPIALATMGTLYALMREAYAAEEGYMEGVKERKKKGQRDTRLIWINPKEVVLTEEMAKKNKEVLEFMFKTGRSAEEYYESKLNTQKIISTPIKNIMVNTNFNDTRIVQRLERIENALQSARLLEVRNRVYIEDNRKPVVNQWIGR